MKLRKIYNPMAKGGLGGEIHPSSEYETFVDNVYPMKFSLGWCNGREEI